MEVEVLMLMSAGCCGGGGEVEFDACCTRSGECGGLEKDGEGGCWKCSGCSTLTLMFEIRDQPHV